MNWIVPSEYGCAKGAWEMRFGAASGWAIQTKVILEFSAFNQRDGLGKARQRFLKQLPKLSDELNEALAG